MLSNLLGGDLVKNVGGIIDSLHTSQEEKDNAKIKLKQLENDLQTKQMEINKVEAGQGGLLVRWRPFLGWVLSLAFAYHFVVQPFLLFAFAAGGVNVQLPEFDMTTMTTVLMGMLGLGGLRSYEKVKGRA